VEPRIQYAKTSDGVNIAFFTEGEGMPFVNVPGAPMSNVQRQRKMPRLREALAFAAARYKLVAFDRRGFGHSQRDVDDFSLDKLLLDVEVVVEHRLPRLRALRAEDVVVGGETPFDHQADGADGARIGLELPDARQAIRVLLGDH